ncbi:hypothetical protein [Leptospirillum ferriphilum]|uniref:Uncharacterized protein n=1 Tax=Leptospirillum ferriphilum YSK TaxID=1441628 RepID=A0A059XZ74_9BACT|nr:hypothetical protein [Leptospirillum ferriphilum]AIA30586.1 hypothetical protein Y981_06960 [Leptospirillum ferriphilum YSK]OOH80833.1 hypothetical protein BOX30_05175 [Leptospirillum ferriphilum]
MVCSERFGSLLFQDSYTIPCVLEPIRLQVFSVARTLFLITIPVATLLLWGKLRDEKPVFTDLLKGLSVFFLLMGYGGAFQDLSLLVGSIASTVYPSTLIVQFYETIWGVPLLPPSGSSFFSLLTDPMGLVYLLLMDFLKVLLFLFTLLRYTLLAFLYAIGPVLCSLAIIPGMYFLLVQWGRNMLEVMLWLVIHNLFVGIFTAINLAGALGSAGGSTLLINETLSIGIMLVLVLMFLLVPIVTHLLLDRSYEGIGSFVGPQAVLFGKKLFSEAVVRPVTTGELPMGMGELKFGSVTRDIGQGRRVYRKKQVRFGPFSLTSLVWKRKNRKTAGSKEAEKQEDEGTETKTPRRRSASSSGRRTTAKKPRSAAATRKVATRKSALPEEPEASDPQKPAEAAPPRPRSRKKKESS